jgi:hypothetical protein
MGRTGPHRGARGGLGALGAAALAAGLLSASWPLSAQPPQLPGTPSLEIPEDLSPEGLNRPLLPDGEPSRQPDHYDDNGFPEDGKGLLSVQPAGGLYWVYLRNTADPFLLLAQFANRQRDAVLLAREGPVRDSLPDGSFQEIPYGSGALKTNSVYISLVEGLLLPHLSDNQKDWRLFPLQDLYVGGSLGLAGLLAELRYVHRERGFGYVQAGPSLAAGGGTWLAPYSYYALALRLGGGLEFPGLLENLIGDNHWSLGGDLLLGFGDADRKTDTPAVVWIPGVFFELEKRDLFGGSPPADYREDPRPFNYRVRALYLRVGYYVDLQNGARSGYSKLDLSLGFRYNVAGPRIPEHRYKETRVVYLSEDYRGELQRQRRNRELRLMEP